LGAQERLRCVLHGWKEVWMFRHNTGVGIASPQIMPLTDNHVDEKSAVPLSDRETRLLSSRSSSTLSRFVDRVYSLSSLRTIPTCRNTFPRAHKTYAQIEGGHDVGGGFGSDSPSFPRPHGGTPPSQHSSSYNLHNHSLRHRRRHAVKRTRSRNNVSHMPLSDLFSRFSHAMTISTSGDSDSSGTSSNYSNRSLGTQPSSFDTSHIPFPSISDDSSRTFPSPCSANAAAVFQTPSDAPHFFDGHVKFREIFEDHMQIAFEEATDGTSTSGTSASTRTSATFSRTASKPPGLIARSRRRVSALAKAVTPARRKFLTIFDKKRPLTRPVDDDDDPVEYSIPCLAYVTCLW